MFNLKPASDSRNIAMMEVMSGPKDLKPRKESCDENWRKIIEILTVLQKSNLHLFFASPLEGPTFFAQLKNFFAQLIFFPPIFFFGFLEKENPSKQIKILAGKKLTEQKRFSLK
jgi:hypothetical protein